MSKTLYLCYFGIREPLVQTQVLPYLRGLQKGGNKVSILTFEPNLKVSWTTQQIKDTKRKLAEDGIEWNFLTYHKRPSAPATLFDVINGAFFVWKKNRQVKLDVIHARIHTPAMMGALAKLFSSGEKPKLLFDIRGFFPEEYTDAGIWKENGWLYKTVKRIEKWLLKESDAFVVLTEKAREILFPESNKSNFDHFGRPVEVIPCCVDLKRFEKANENSRAEIRNQLNIENRQVIVYVGSFGGWYLSDQMLDFLSAAREKRNDAFALILTQRDTDKISAQLKNHGFEEKDFYVGSATPSEIPRYLSAADFALSFIKPCFSKLASSPTKIAEYLASGLPIISNRGVGDIDELIESNRVGVLLDGFSKNDYLKALEEIEKLLTEDKEIIERCRITAQQEFDLYEVGERKYLSVYKRLLKKNETNSRACA